jgi:uncharacterized membrane protein YccC
VEQRRPSLIEAVEEAHQIAESCQREHEKAKSQIEQDKIMLNSHLACRPGFFSRLFATAAWKSWRSTLQKLSATLQQSVLRAQETDGALELARTEWSNIESQLQQLDQEISSKCQAVSKLKATEAEARNRMGDRVVDERFFEREHEAIHLTAPWLPDEVHRLREDLFAAALTVHKTFIDASASRLQHNLGLLMSGMGWCLPVFRSP